MKPISVIIPVYNREKLVLRTIESVFAQTYRPVELIVVDNNSTDSSLNAVRSWGAAHENGDFVVKVLSEQRKGATIARQTGFEHSTSEFLLFFDSDDTMDPNLLERVMEQFTRYPGTEMVYWRSAIANTDGTMRRRHFSTRNLMRRHMFNAMFSTQSFAVKSDFFRRSGGWDPTLPGWNDWELGLRLLLMNPRMRGIRDTLVTIYPQKESITGTDFTSKQGQWELALDAMEKVARLQPEPTRSRLLGMLAYRRVILAAHYKKEGSDKVALSLLESTLASSSLPAWRKRLLRFIYNYTAKGGRCAYILWH